jgi:hypothetical protein
MNITEKKNRRIELFKAIADLPNSIYESKENFIAEVAYNEKLISILENITRRDLYILLFDRMPEDQWTIDLISVLNTAIDSAILYDFLISEEMGYIGELVYAKTVDSAGINIFIHVPKTAGSSVNTILATDKIVLTNQDPSDFMKISLLYANERPVESIYISGHRPLSLYENNIDLTEVNSIFTVVRDPIDLAISFFNFAVTMSDKNDENWGTYYNDIVIEWKKNTTSMKEFFLKYTESLFFDEQVRFIYEEYYGDINKEKKSPKELIDYLARLGVVIIKPEKLNNYLGIRKKKDKVRVNVSKHYVTRDTLGFSVLHHLRNKMIGSIEFYALLDNFDSWRNNGIINFHSLKEYDEY